MTRVKRGLAAHKRHKNILAKTKGYRHGRRKVFRLAKQAWLKASQHAYRHRRTKKREFRGLWIIRINAAARSHDLSYSQLMRGLKLAKIDLDRKVLAQLAIDAPEEFSQIVEKAKAQLQSVK